MEYLDRGLVAVKVSNGIFLSWRIYGNDNKNVEFNLYRNEVLVNDTPITGVSNYTDKDGTVTDKYEVEAISNGQVIDKSAVCTPWGQQYMTVQLNLPPAGVTPPNVYYDGKSSSSTVQYPDGEAYTYTPNDMSVGDVDGDGEYELIVKWNPSNSKDNSETGITGNVYIDAYKLDGTQLWRIDLGKNIRAGAHYTQFMVYDFDGDGLAEMVCKTAPGTIDGAGNFVLMGSDDPNADYRNLNIAATGNTRTGVIQNGPEYLTLFDGKTGKELHTIAYKPSRSGSWGDKYGNRVDRFLACVAYLDGVHPSVVMCRGYYTRATLAAYDVVNKKLVERWFYDSGTSASASNAYGQGNHSIAVGDVDEDGFDEIIYGGAAIDHNGKLLYNTRIGHGDAGHLSDLDPDRPGLEWFQPHEEKTAAYGYEFRDARSGQVLWGQKTGSDIGRGIAADIDPRHRGFESWCSSTYGTYNCKGEQISTKIPSSINFRVYWDGDLQDELLNKNAIGKWDYLNSKTNTILTMSGCSSNNTTKATPNLSADIFGDWREEVILYETNDPSKIRIYTTTIPTSYGLYTLMHDPIYRLSIAWQNVAYNQPPHLGFYIGDGLDDIPYPDMYVAKYNNNPQSIDDTQLMEDICKVYSLANGDIRIESQETIKEVSLYGVNGSLYWYGKNIGDSDYTISGSVVKDNMCIVKVITDSGTLVSKIIK